MHGGERKGTTMHAAQESKEVGKSRERSGEGIYTYTYRHVEGNERGSAKGKGSVCMCERTGEKWGSQPCTTAARDVIHLLRRTERESECCVYILEREAATLCRRLYLCGCVYIYTRAAHGTRRRRR